MLILNADAYTDNGGLSSLKALAKIFTIHITRICSPKLVTKATSR